MNKRPVPPRLQLISRLVSIACVVLTLVLIYVAFIMPAAPPEPRPPARLNPR